MIHNYGSYGTTAEQQAGTAVDKAPSPMPTMDPSAFLNSIGAAAMGIGAGVSSISQAFRKPQQTVTVPPPQTSAYSIPTTSASGGSAVVGKRKGGGMSTLTMALLAFGLVAVVGGGAFAAKKYKYI